jgi:hypothetical protein
MLAMNSYPQAYIDACRARVDSQLAAFRKLAAAKKRAAGKEPSLDAAFEAFETTFFNNMVIVLEGYFVHRTRGPEKKDGNPLNEVRVLTNSMLQNGERMMAESTLKMNPARSVLRHAVGDPIRLREADFTRLASAFFADLESKYAG